MNANFSRALADVLLSEGGYSNHPDDKGGPTNLGITLATFRKWVKRDGTVSDLKALTREQAAKCYRAVYWNAVKGDDLPSGVDYAVFDYAVNSGPSRAVKALQSILGVAVDGQVGPETLGALKTASAVSVVNKLCDQRMAFLESLPNWPTFHKGWSRRVAAVREDALQLSSAPAPVPQEPAKPSPAPIPSVPSPKPSLGLWGLLEAIVKAVLGLLGRK